VDHDFDAPPAVDSNTDTDFPTGVGISVDSAAVPVDKAGSGNSSETGTVEAADLPAVPDGAAAVFGSALDQAVAFAGMLATQGVEQGLIGPHEVPRLWDRHLLNCAVVAELIRDRSRTLVDI